jgi:hypothetical protein
MPLVSSHTVWNLASSVGKGHSANSSSDQATFHRNKTWRRKRGKRRVSLSERKGGLLPVAGSKRRMKQLSPSDTTCTETVYTYRKIQWEIKRNSATITKCKEARPVGVDLALNQFSTSQSSALWPILETGGMWYTYPSLTRKRTTGRLELSKASSHQPVCAVGRERLVSSIKYAAANKSLLRSLCIQHLPPAR